LTAGSSGDVLLAITESGLATDVARGGKRRPQFEALRSGQEIDSNWKTESRQNVLGLIQL